MRKLVFPLAVLLMTSGYVLASDANEKEKSAKSSRVEVVATAKESVYQVTYDSEVAGTVKVNIYDAQNSLLYSDFVRNAKTFHKSYDFNGLSAGEYRIEVINNEGKTQQTIQYKLVDKTQLNAVISTVDATGKYTLKVQRKQVAPVIVNIYDKNDVLIYQDEINVDSDFSRIYDFSKSFAKASVFEVYSNGTVIKQLVP